MKAVDRLAREVCASAHLDGGGTNEDVRRSFTPPRRSASHASESAFSITVVCHHGGGQTGRSCIDEVTRSNADRAAIREALFWLTQR